MTKKNLIEYGKITKNEKTIEKKKTNRECIF